MNEWMFIQVLERIFFLSQWYNPFNAIDLLTSGQELKSFNWKTKTKQLIVRNFYFLTKCT